MIARFRGGPHAGLEMHGEDFYRRQMALPTYVTARDLTTGEECVKLSDTNAVYELALIREADGQDTVYCPVYSISGEIVTEETAYFVYVRTHVQADGVLRTTTTPQDLEDAAFSKTWFEEHRSTFGQGEKAA